MKGRKFLVLGNDKKMSACRDKLISEGYEADLYSYETGFDTISEYDNIILPLPTLANSKISGTDKSIEDLYRIIKKHQKVFCGNIDVSPYDNYYSYYYDEKFLLNNSRLTAQGVLRLIVDNVDVDLMKLKTVVIGYGRCGKEICRLLKSCGMTVISASRRKVTQIEAKTNGMEASSVEMLESLIPYTDIFINTVPVNILNKSFVSKFDHNKMYVEVASKPYGFDISKNDLFNFKYILAESLPGRFVPESAGENIADTVLKILKEEEYG